MKDGRTHLAHKVEHGVDMDTGAVVSVTVQEAVLAIFVPPASAQESPNAPAEGVPLRVVELLLNMQSEIAHLRARVEELSSFAGGHVGPFVWNHGDGEVRMIPVDEGVCYVSYVAGQFAGNGEWYQLDQATDSGA